MTTIYTPFTHVALGATFWSLHDDGSPWLKCIKVGNVASMAQPHVHTDGGNPFGGMRVNAVALAPGEDRTRIVNGKPYVIPAGQVLRCEENEAVILDAPAPVLETTA